MTARSPSSASQCMLRIDVLPGEQEALEFGDGDRSDVGAQPVERVAMDAREQPAIAPFGGRPRHR